MELDIIKLIKEIGISGTAGVLVVLFMKHYIQKIMDQNTEFINYLIKNNEKLLETNTKIHEESTKTIEEHTKVIKTLTEELRKQKRGV